MLVKEVLLQLLVCLSPKDFKGQGIGTALIAALKDLAIAQNAKVLV